MTADKRVVFLLSSIERLTYMRVRVWGIWRSGKIYLWKFQRDQKSGQYVLLLSGAYRKTIQRARARFLHRTERKKNEKLIVRREIADSFKILRWEIECFASHSLWSQMYDWYIMMIHINFLLTVRKVTSKMPRESQNYDIQNNNSLLCWISSRSYRNMTKEVYHSQYFW